MNFKKALIITKIFGLRSYYLFLFFRMEFVAKKVYCVWMKKNGPSSCSTCFFSYDGLFMNANDYTMHHWPWNSKSQKGVDSKRPGNMQRIFNQVSIRLCSFEVNGTSRKKMKLKDQARHGVLKLCWPYFAHFWPPIYLMSQNFVTFSVPPA